MKTLLLFIFCFTVAIGQAQLLDNLKGKAKNSASNRAADFNTTRSNKEKIISTNEEQGGGSVEGSDLNQDSNEQSGNSNLTVADVYTFNTKLTYSYQVFNETETTEALLISYYFGTENFSQVVGSNLLINDLNNKVVVLVDESTNTAYANADTLSVVDSNPVKTNDLSTFTKTGNSKEILGYQCEEYEVLENNSKIIIWMSNDPRITPEQLAELSKHKNLMLGNINQENSNSGMIFEIQQYDDQGKLIFQFQTTEFMPEEKIIDLRNYQLIKN